MEKEIAIQQSASLPHDSRDYGDPENNGGTVDIDRIDRVYR